MAKKKKRRKLKTRRKIAETPDWKETAIHRDCSGCGEFKAILCWLSDADWDQPAEEDEPLCEGCTRVYMNRVSRTKRVLIAARAKLGDRLGRDKADALQLKCADDEETLRKWEAKLGLSEVA